MQRFLYPINAVMKLSIESDQQKNNVPINWLLMVIVKIFSSPFNEEKT